MQFKSEFITLHLQNKSKNINNQLEMKAYIFNKYSKTEKLQLSEVAEPLIKDNEVLVQIYASSINQLDAKLKEWRI